MGRSVDYEQRRKAILEATISRYITDAIPVASEDIARQFKLSPATIRNIFAELEEAGYLTHPYTSGGRVPTKQGYRYYVDFLISQMALLDNEKDAILEKYQQRMAEVEEILDRTSEVISVVTHCAGIVSLLEWQDKFFYKGITYILEQPEFRDFDKIRILIKIIEERGHLLHIINREFSDRVKVYIGEEMECPQMVGCSLIVSSYRINDKMSGKLAVLGPMRMRYEHIIPKLEYISDVLTDLLAR